MTLAADVRVEIQEASASLYTDAEVTAAITDALLMFSLKRPYVKTDTMATIEDSRLVDISGITDLLYGYDEASFDSMYGCEYPVATTSDNYWPRKFRNFTIVGTDLVMDLSTPPEDTGDDVNVMYYAVYTENTLPAGYRRILVELATAILIRQKTLNFINEWFADTTKWDEIDNALNQMTQRVSKAIEDLARGREISESEDADYDIKYTMGKVLSEIQIAQTYFNKGNYGHPEIEHLNSAASDLNAMNAMMGASATFGSFGQAELNAVYSYLNRVRGGLDKMRVQLNSTNLAGSYDTLARQRIAEIEAKIAPIAITRQWRIWPRG